MLEFVFLQVTQKEPQSFDKFNWIMTVKSNNKFKNTVFKNIEIA